jgi:hypothetical protein
MLFFVLAARLAGWLDERLAGFWLAGGRTWLCK